MVDNIDAAFKALANPARRDIVTRLAFGPASTSALAEPLDMTLAAVTQHLQHLEAAQLVTSHKAGRTRVHEIRHDGIRKIELWLASQRNRWEVQLERLDSAVASLTVTGESTTTGKDQDDHRDS